MVTRDPVDMLLSGRMDRRAFTQSLGALGLGFATTTLASRSALAAEDEASYFTWSGYDVPEFMGSYIERYNMVPSYALWGEEEEGFQKMRAGFKPDLAHPCTYSLGRWYDAGLLKALDTSRLEHWDDLFPNLRERAVQQPVHTLVELARTDRGLHLREDELAIRRVEKPCKSSESSRNHDLDKR